eukprot:TRINITY_DN10921_c0_g1_i1.p1 TRINITY_DN10921_c0_g1~~TRINITY_DN10921_c0_g1_i1.p1  ORF type:complete len:121 (+),score=30.77 TRINITY_DN10921_c0_g1_i1:295-657(+)
MKNFEDNNKKTIFPSPHQEEIPLHQNEIVIEEQQEQQQPQMIIFGKSSNSILDNQSKNKLNEPEQQGINKLTKKNSNYKQVSPYFSNYRKASKRHTGFAFSGEDPLVFQQREQGFYDNYE